ncbi:hypothetical protein PsYK624_092920 [Phanerochaete sordida]|uniref:Secreted protein n=1 Tax=Phanerochaete sordida TaxID=48140 RepID=A0A9P3LFW9_9APHY|nr:hypothetical protein PsYK624_092920 [Phanerochaete sordida]
MWLVCCASRWVSDPWRCETRVLVFFSVVLGVPPCGQSETCDALLCGHFDEHRVQAFVGALQNRCARAERFHGACRLRAATEYRVQLVSALPFRAAPAPRGRRAYYKGRSLRLIRQHPVWLV